MIKIKRSNNKYKNEIILSRVQATITALINLVNHVERVI